MISNSNDSQDRNSTLALDIPETDVVNNNTKNDSPMMKQPSHYDLDNTPTMSGRKKLADDVDEPESWISDLITDEDFKQKLSMIITVTIEMYRVIMSSLLILFVPQSCNNQQCSINDKLSPSMPYETFVLICNFVTLFAFTITYTIESRRETILINYLDVNRFKPRDNDSVAKELLHLSKHRLNRIEKYNKIYKSLSYSSIGVFALNTLFSSIVIFDNFLDSKTITVFLTNMLFMSSKLYDMYGIINTKDFVFLSAYLTRKIQFNDVDKDKVEYIDNDNENGNENDNDNYIDCSAPPEG